MTIEDLKLFTDVWQTGNITRAANAHYLTQSATSKRIASLERELGISLFLRGKGKTNVKLTPAGQEFSDIAARMLTLYEQASELRKNADRGYLTVACINSVQNYLLPPMVFSLEQKFPHLCITLEDHHTSEIITLVENNRVDIGIAHAPAPFSDLTSILLYEETYRVVMRDVQTAFPVGSVLQPEQLSPGNEIFESFGAVFQEWHDRWWDLSSAKIRVNVTPTAEHYLYGDRDWIILPSAVALEMEGKGFRSYALTPEPPLHRVYLIYHTQTKNTFLHSFVEEAANYFEPFTKLLQEKTGA